MRSIVLAAPLYPPDIGGPATDASSLRKVLISSGEQVAVIPFATVRALPPGIRHVVYIFRLWQAAKHARCIVAFDTVSVGLPAALVARLTGCALVVRVPGDYAWEQGVQRFGVEDTIDAFQKGRYGWRTETLRFVQRFVVKQARLVVVPSLYFKELVLGWGVVPERLKHIYLGMDMSPTIIETHVPQEKTLFSVGRLVPWKGFMGIIELLPRLPEWNAVIAGDGPQAELLRVRAQECGVADRVTFTGTLSHDEVLGWCGSADAFVLNTSFESFSFQVLEAMAQSARIITTRVGSLPELISDGVEGVLCKPNDTEAFVRAIKSVEEEEEIWERRRKAARQKALQFSLEASGNAFRKAILDVCT